MQTMFTVATEEFNARRRENPAMETK